MKTKNRTHRPKVWIVAVLAFTVLAINGCSGSKKNEESTEDSISLDGQAAEEFAGTDQFGDFSDSTENPWGAPAEGEENAAATETDPFGSPDAGMDAATAEALQQADSELLKNAESSYGSETSAEEVYASDYTSAPVEEKPVAAATTSQPKKVKSKKSNSYSAPKIATAPVHSEPVQQRVQEEKMDYSNDSVESAQLSPPDLEPAPTYEAPEPELAQNEPARDSVETVSPAEAEREPAEEESGGFPFVWVIVGVLAVAAFVVVPRFYRKSNF